MIDFLTLENWFSNETEYDIYIMNVPMFQDSLDIQKVSC